MKIAVPHEDGNIYQHFGHTEQFKIYNIENGKVISSDVIFTEGNGHGALAGFLKDHSVDTLICGGIGGGAKTALSESNIQLYPGVNGDADTVVQSFLNGSLKYDPNTVCNHHTNEHHHSCGEHGCGDHE